VPRDGLASDEVERVIASAIASCRIPPARAAHYRTMAKGGTDIAPILASLAPYPGNAGVNASTRSRPTAEDDDLAYAAMFPTVQEQRDQADAQLAASVYSTASDQETYESIYGAGSWEK
jgi:hypothetical protein